ncbi:MAG: RNA-binding protein [Verrucomicrobia bacterium]|nr:RNA-binding protein [Verrucomicrobiota bacterium]
MLRRHQILLCIGILSLITVGCSGEAPKSKKKDSSVTKKEQKSQQPLFTLTNKDETGFYFENRFTETEGLNSLTYEYVYNGGGVAIGDINNDGLQDIFISGNNFGGGLFLNRGDLRFEDITRSAGVLVKTPFVTGISMVDINNDGYDDIYMCKSLDRDPKKRANVLLINNQDLTFTDKADEYGLADESYSNYASFFDYDLDGDLDMYLLNHRHDFKVAANLKGHREKYGDVARFGDTTYEYISDRLYRNNGPGREFTDVTEKSGVLNWGYGLSATVGDINKDGYPDIFVANDYSSKDNLYINNGNGTFTDKLEEYVFHISKHSMGSDIADFNNDAQPDIVTLDMISEDNYRQKQLKWLSTYDLYHLFTESGLYHQVVRNTLQLNNGDGTFSEIGQLSGISHTDWSWSPLFADYDNDGFKDIFISNGYFRDGNDQDYVKYRSAKVIDAAGGFPKVKKMDLINQMKSTKINNYIYKNNGDLTFTKKSREWGFRQPSFSNGAAFADLDNDGDLDIVTNNFNQQAFLYRNNLEKLEVPKNYLRIRLKGVGNNPRGIGAKVTISTDNGIQYLENSPYRGYFSSSEGVLHFGLGNLEKVNEITIEWPEGELQKLKNVKANQELTIDKNNLEEHNSLEEEKAVLLEEVSNAFSKSYLHKEDAFIDFKREPLLEHMISNKGPFMTIADFNGDELEDIFIGASSGAAAMVFAQTASGEFKNLANPSFSKDAKYEDAQSVAFDLEGDGDLDLYVVSGGYAHAKGSPLYEDRVYINNGKGVFQRAKDVLTRNAENGTCVVAHDIDMDGDVDLFVGGGASPIEYPLEAKSILWINEGGNFKNATAQLPNNGKIGMINAAAWFDYNGDQQKELLLAGEWMPLKLFQYKDNIFKDISALAGLEKTAGWWNTITVQDINNDNRPDVLIGNRGDNSFFNASPAKPAQIYAKDFDNNGSMDALPFYYYSDGKMYPKHSMDEIFTQYPGIRRKFGRYDKFSRAGLNEIFSQEELLGVEKREVHTFSSSVLLNQKDGTLKLTKLPLQAQFSEVHGILVKDINGDNIQDVLISGNQYGTDVSMGRSDASFGTLLLGDGKGNFKPTTVQQSGFKVIGDMRGVYQLKTNSGELIIVLRNKDTPKVFKLKKPNA